MRHCIVHHNNRRVIEKRLFVDLRRTFSVYFYNIVIVISTISFVWILISSLVSLLSKFFEV